MKMNYASRFVLSLMLMVGHGAFAGGVSDGGGDAVVCKDASGKVVSAELFDLFESRVLYNFKLINQDQQDPLKTALAAAKRIDNGGAASDPTMMDQGEMSLNLKQVGSDFVQSYVRYINQNLQILPPGVGLKPLDDENNMIIPTSCKLMQLALYHDSNDKIYAAGDIWKYLTPTHKAGLLVHEALYKKLRMNGETTSERARMAVGASLAGQSLTPITEGVPSGAMKCWSVEDDFKFRFVIYEKNKQAVYQFLHLDGKIPLTKTSFQGDLTTSPLNMQFNGGISSTSIIQDSVLDQGHKIHWTFQRKSLNDFEMTLGSAQKSYTIQCNDTSTPPDDVPWPWDFPPVGEVRFDAKKTYLIDAQAMSCFERPIPGGFVNYNISPSHFRLPNFEIDWFGSTSDLYVVAVKVHADMPDGTVYESTIAGDELASLDGSHGRWSAKIPRQTKSGDGVFKAACAPIFGGVNVPAGMAPFKTPAKVSIIGFSRDDAGNEKPESIEKEFELIYR